MSRLYFDSSSLCKLYWREHGSRELAALAAGADEIACGIHGRAEFYSVGHRKRREGVADAAAIKTVFAQFEADRAAGGLALLPLTETILDRVAVAFADAPASCFLRAADALHLATAAEHRLAEIYSNDRHLLEAAPLFGLRGIDVIP